MNPTVFVRIASTAVILTWLLFLSTSPIIAQWNEQSLQDSISWQQVREESGIRISIGEWPGSDFAAFRSEMIFETSMDRLLELIQDVAAYTEWMPSSIESRLLKRTGEFSFVYYISIKSPWPLNDRDWVNRLEVMKSAHNESVSVLYESVQGYVAERADTVRVKNHFALWNLTPIGRNKIRSIWYAHNEPGGLIPAWAVHIVSDSMILETMQNVKNRVQAAVP